MTIVTTQQLLNYRQNNLIIGNLCKQSDSFLSESFNHFVETSASRDEMVIVIDPSKTELHEEPYTANNSIIFDKDHYLDGLQKVLEYAECEDNINIDRVVVIINVNVLLLEPGKAESLLNQSIELINNSKTKKISLNLLVGDNVGKYCFNFRDYHSFNRYITPDGIKYWHVHKLLNIFEQWDALRNLSIPDAAPFGLIIHAQSDQEVQNAK